MKTSNFENISELVRKKRMEINTSQTELSNKLGYKNGQFISNVERGLCSIPIKKIKPLCEVLGLPTEEVKMAVLQDYENRIEQVLRQ